MEMQPVTSSNVEAVGYDPATRELHVTFLNNAHYVYHDVPPEAHRDLLNAPSVGKHLHQHIKSAYHFHKHS